MSPEGFAGNVKRDAIAVAGVPVGLRERTEVIQRVNCAHLQLGDGSILSVSEHVDGGLRHECQSRPGQCIWGQTEFD